ncbi:Rne/Rng family ribonuclease [Fundidesulfovibrio terrae]|uniref:Rne/Rng family ribonuclease n=1 Tax=Fundidesulfovibrio terrae TaxID=2922866 RepID=UPI001FAFADF7|nr:Rne/Rng family ribonuclease [Fundidesulfovibrio terrae]
MAAKKRKRKMFISVLPGEEVEVAVTEDGVLQEYYVEMTHQAKTRGNIYKGKIHNVDPSLQAAFINYGAERNGFLQIDEVHPEYYLEDSNTERKGKYPPIQKVLKKGQEILIQVVKEPTGNKGAFVTSYLSLPGRYFVLTPGREQKGISRKVEDDEERKRLKEIAAGVKLDEGIGVIVRTASIGQSKAALERDISYLKRLWKDVRGRGTSVPTPSMIYQEPDLAARAVRDYLTDDVNEVWVDDKATAERVTEMAALVFPRRQGLVRHHTDAEHSMWERFSLRKQIEQLHGREVTLPSGGRLVIDHTEALTAVDVNSGKIGGETNFKEMALKTNLEAAAEVANQLRLRDIGGQVVVDFIELKDRKHVAEVEKAMKSSMKIDRARHDVGKISRFGLMEIVRQRMGSSAMSVSTETCPCCQGTGTRRNLEWQSLMALRELYRLLRRAGAGEAVTFRAGPELSFYLLNQKRQRLQALEEQYQKAIHILPE